MPLSCLTQVFSDVEGPRYSHLSFRGISDSAVGATFVYETVSVNGHLFSKQYPPFSPDIIIKDGGYRVQFAGLTADLYGHSSNQVHNSMVKIVKLFWYQNATKR